MIIASVAFLFFVIAAGVNAQFNINNDDGKVSDIITSNTSTCARCLLGKPNRVLTFDHDVVEVCSASMTFLQGTAANCIKSKDPHARCDSGEISSLIVECAVATRRSFNPLLSQIRRLKGYADIPQKEFAAFETNVIGTLHPPSPLTTSCQVTPTVAFQNMSPFISSIVLTPAGDFSEGSEVAQTLGIFCLAALAGPVDMVFEISASCSPQQRDFLKHQLEHFRTVCSPVAENPSIDAFRHAVLDYMNSDDGRLCASCAAISNDFAPTLRSATTLQSTPQDVTPFCMVLLRSRGDSPFVTSCANDVCHRPLQFMRYGIREACDIIIADNVAQNVKTLNDAKSPTIDAFDTFTASLVASNCTLICPSTDILTNQPDFRAFCTAAVPDCKILCGACEDCKSGPTCATACTQTCGDCDSLCSTCFNSTCRTCVSCLDPCHESCPAGACKSDCSDQATKQGTLDSFFSLCAKTLTVDPVKKRE